MIEAAHWAFGAGGGAAFGALPRDWRRRRWAGPVYGLVVWLALSSWQPEKPLFGLTKKA